MTPAPHSPIHTPRTIGVVGVAARGLYRSRLPQMAAALAYRTIFGIIPVLIVSLVVVQYVVDDDKLTHWIESAVKYIGIEGIMVDAQEESAGAELAVPTQGNEQNSDSAADPESVSANPNPDASTGSPQGVEQLANPGVGSSDSSITDPEAQSDPETESVDDSGLEQNSEQAGHLDAWIVDAVNRVRGISFKAIGIFGVMLLIYAAISMLVEIERTFNQVYRAPRGRSWARRVVTYWTLLTLGALLLCATFVVGGQFKSWVGAVADAQGVGLSSPLSVTVTGFLITVLISTLLLWIIYITVPTTRVHLRSALAGAFVAAILWEAGKWGFTQYLSFAGSSKYATLYGSIALIPLFLLWIYVTWLIVLFGLQVSYGIQMLGSWRELATEGDEDEQVVDPFVVVPIMMHIAQRFAEGNPTDSNDIAARIGVHEILVGRILERLTNANLINRVEGDGESAAFAPARPAEEIPVRELLVLGDELAVHTEQLGCEQIRDRLRKAKIGEIGDLSLAALVSPGKIDASQEGT